MDNKQRTYLPGTTSQVLGIYTVEGNHKNKEKNKELKKQF